MDNITTDYLITLADLNEDRLYDLYAEAISKLRSKDISTQDRKVYTIRVMCIRSLISDRYSLKLRHRTPDFDDPMRNPKVNRFYK